MIVTNVPVKGVYRSFLAAGEAICFGVDSIGFAYVKEAGIIFAFYALGVIVFIYLAAFHITETEYFAGEEGVVIPKHVVEENLEKATDAHIETFAVEIGTGSTLGDKHDDVKF